jgi:hypothetical protein
LLALGILLLIVIALTALKAYRIWGPTKQVLQDLQALQAIDPGALSDLDPVQLEALQHQFARLETNLGIIQREAQPFLSVAGYLGWVPGFGPEMEAAPHLLSLAHDTAAAGRAAMDGALPVVSSIRHSGEGSTLARIVTVLAEAQPAWAEAEAALDQVASARAQIDMAELDPRLAAQIERLDQYLPLLQKGVSMAQLAPTLMGVGEAQTYLLLAQNSDELRPTGGFISGVGLLTLVDGEIQALDFQDSYQIYSSQQDHPPAPPDLERYMKTDMLVFRDSNWSPDFPTSAAVAQSLYLLNTGRESDGVIAFDMELTRRLVQALEPLALPGYAESVTSTNLISAIRAVWAAPGDVESNASVEGSSDWWLHRKDFMGDLAAAALRNLEGGQVDLGVLLQALYGSLLDKHLVISLKDPEVKSLLAEMGWDGALRPPAGDFLLVVDSNVGWNKVNSLVVRETDYRVTPGENGSGQAELVLTYHHQGVESELDCQHVTKEYGDSYEDLMERCYFNYLRVYVPGDAQLLSVEGLEPDSATIMPGERGTSVLAGFLVLPPGHKRQVRFTYALPAGTIQGDTYWLRVQKQPGTPAWPIQMTLLDPTGEWRPVSPAGTNSPEGVNFSWKLNQDTEIFIQRHF